MTTSCVKVFRAGKGTFTAWEFDAQGNNRGRLENVGAGTFLDRIFESESEAREFCTAELGKKPTDVFYLMQGDLIVETVINEKELFARQRRSDMVYGATSTLVIGVIAATGFLVTSPFQSAYANLVLAIIAIVLYMLLLWVFGLGNIEAAVAMVIFLSCAFLIISAVKKSRARKARQNQSSTLLMTPQTASTSTHSG